MRYLSGVSLDIYNLVQRLAAIVNISEKTKIASDAVVNLRYSYDSEYVYGILYTYMYVYACRWMYSVLHAKEHTRPSVEVAKKPWTSGRGNALEMQIETCRWKQTVRQTVIVTHVVRVMAYLTNCRQPDKLIGLTVRERECCLILRG